MLDKTVTYSKLSDKELTTLLKQGDKTAFTHIYNRYWSKLYLSAYNILREQQGSEDIVQEILVQLWLKREHQQIDSLKAYLHTAIRFQVFKAIRAGKVRMGLFEQIESININNEADYRLMENDINSIYEKGLAELPEKCREIFTLSRKEQLSNKEIAERLNISVKTVENQMTIALKRLKSSMGDVLFWATVMLAGIWK